MKGGEKNCWRKEQKEVGDRKISVSPLSCNKELEFVCLTYQHTWEITEEQLKLLLKKYQWTINHQVDYMRLNYRI